MATQHTLTFIFEIKVCSIKLGYVMDVINRLKVNESICYAMLEYFDKLKNKTVSLFVT